MFIFIKSDDTEILPLQSAIIESVYNTYKNEDGFLYITYAGENVFG
jgi:GABA(A) receptor-associated protein